MTGSYHTVALLPLKAKSQRVKDKNFRDFCGKPLFRWILDSLLELSEIDLVVINTDARARLADHGVDEHPRVLLRDRPSAICGDDVSMNLVIRDDLENVRSERYLMTHATNPLVRPQTIRDVLASFEDAKRTKNGCDSIFTVNRVQTRFYREDASPVNHDPANLIPTQDLEPWFEENSNLYVFTRPSFLSSGARIGSRPKMYETPPLESIDIDTPADWDLARIAAEHLDLL